MTRVASITGGRHGRPYAAALRDIGADVYVEEEFALEGEAVAYRMQLGRTRTLDGRWRVEEDDPRPFRTRVLVRRPFDPAHFNGVVVVVWIDVDGDREIVGWETPEATNGSAWAFVSASRAGVHGTAGDGRPGGLVAWDPDRYGTLLVDGDDLGYDILTHAAEAVGPLRSAHAHPDDPDPLGGLDAQYVVAAGSGRAAARVATYRNAIQARTEAFDGFLLDRWAGAGAALGDDDPTGAGDTPTRLRDDVEVPTLVCNTEDEASSHADVARADDDRLRVWEIAGASHHTVADVRLQRAKAARDHGEAVDAVVAGPHLTDLDAGAVRDAALRVLVDWVRTGDTPPEQPRFSIDPRTGDVERDDTGLAVGGIRLPEVAAPPGRDDDHARRLAHFERAARAATRAGVLLPRDRDRMVFAARAAAPW